MNCYGQHLILRICHIEKKENLINQELILKFITELVRRIKMRVLAGPIGATEKNEKGSSGCSALILLYESHASIHTYSDLAEAFIDVFSCKPYSEKIVLEVITKYFGHFQVVERSLLNRGEHWQKNIEEHFRKEQIVHRG